MLFKSLNKLKRSTIMTTIVLMVTGNLLLIIPDSYFGFLSSALGFVLLVCCVSSLFNYLGSRKALINYIALTIGLFVGVFGAMLFIFDGLLLNALMGLVSTIPILFGAYGIYHSFAFAKRSGRWGWWILVILSGLLMIFGGFIYMNPWMESTSATIQVIGGTLMYSAFVSALQLIWIWPIHND